MDSDSTVSYSSEESEDYEPEQEDINVKCLFCTETFNNMKCCIAHCQHKHNFSIHNICQKFQLDHYGYIKLINYIRKMNVDPDMFLTLEDELWSDDENLKPHDSSDPWLWYETDDLIVENDCETNFPKYVNSESGNVTMSAEHFAHLQDTIVNLSQEVKNKETQLSRLKQICGELESQNDIPLLRDVGTIPGDTDRGYFRGYSYASVHLEMLNDEIRTCSYRDSLMNNKSLVKGKLVMDLGCGTGILSMLAVTAGAEKVIAVDESDVLYHAMDIIRMNEMSGKIELVKGRIEDITLPVSSKFDILMSEWMGYFLLYEGMLDSVIFARDKFLKPNGIILPSRAKLYLIGACNMDNQNYYVSFWDNVYGYDMSNMKETCIKDALVETVPPEYIITDSCEILSLDMNICKLEQLNFKQEFKLKCIKTGELTQIVGYFEIFFDLPSPVFLSTSPYHKATHWKQLSLLLKDPIQMKEGEVITGEIECSRNRERIRHLVIELKIKDMKQTYFVE